MNNKKHINIKKQKEKHPVQIGQKEKLINFNL